MITTQKTYADWESVAAEPAQEIINYLGHGQTGDDEIKAVIEGLTAKQKSVSPKYFYDARGSELFDQICEQPEYYPTRSELNILQKYGREIVQSGNFGNFVELGSGSDKKISVLLSQLTKSQQRDMLYVPVDISGQAVKDAYHRLSKNFPALQLMGIVADFTQSLRLPKNTKPRLISFFGGTIGNFTDQHAVHFLSQVKTVMTDDDKFLLGFDLRKSRPIMEAAYNDKAGVTAQFNKNVLHVLNQKFQGNFDAAKFRHKAFFNETESRIEMHLESLENHHVRLSALDLEITFQRAETIHTEISRKFTLPQMQQLTKRAGLVSEKVFTDENGYFALMVLTPK